MNHPKQTPPQTKTKIKRIDVTDLTLMQQRQLFRDCLNQEGFVGFIKEQQHNRTGLFSITMRLGNRLGVETAIYKFVNCGFREVSLETCVFGCC
jgi:hypothetical protein